MGLMPRLMSMCAIITSFQAPLLLNRVSCTAGLRIMYRAGQNHTYTVHIRYFWLGNHQRYGHIRCICVYVTCTVLANPNHVPKLVLKGAGYAAPILGWLQSSKAHSFKASGILLQQNSPVTLKHVFVTLGHMNVGLGM